MNFNDWLKEWLKVYKKPYLKPSSIERIETILRKHVPLELGTMELQNIKAFNIDKALASCSMSRTRKYMYYVFTNALKKAYRIDLIDSDITLKTEPVKHHQKNGKALTLQEQSEFIKAIQNSKYKNLFLFYLYTGTRRGEALSLCRFDLDFEDREFLIRGTKTQASERTFFMIPELYDILKNQLQLIGEYSSRIFPYNKDNVSHAFKKYCKNHHLHDLRHTFITRCAENGININVTKKLVGHSDINTTLKIYTHVTTSFQKNEFSKFDINI